MRKFFLPLVASIGMMACGDDIPNSSYKKTVRVVGTDYCDGKFVVEVLSDASSDLSNNERYAVANLPNQYQKVGSVLKIKYTFDEKNYACPMRDFTYKFITIQSIIND